MRLSALGDVIVSASLLCGALETLKNKYGAVQIEWFVDEQFAGILCDSPCIAHLHALPFKKWLKSPRGIYKIWRYLHSCGEYSAVIDMQGLLKSAFVGKILCTKNFIGFSARGCRERIASIFYTHTVDIPYDANILVRNFTLLKSVFGENDSLQSLGNLESLECAIMESPKFKRFIEIRGDSFGINMKDLWQFSDEFLNSTLENHIPYANDSANSLPNKNLTPTKPLKFLFILEASIAAKMYPHTQYCLLAEILKAYYQNIAIYIIWNSDEKGADTLHTMLKSRQICAIKLPRLDFNRIKFVLKNMDMVIGGDTGITHLSWAMGARNIVLLGNAPHTSGKNMSKTRLKRILLGNPFVLSTSGKFEIASIEPQRIFERIKMELEYK